MALLLIALPLVFSGCSDIETPTAKEALTHPLGTQPPFQRGTSKKEVLAYWGEPDQVVVHGVDELGLPKEEWIYTARLPGVPIDVRYVSKTKHLFFEGENLVRWETEEGESPKG